MRRNDIFTEKAEVPIPKCFGSVSRIWKLKNDRKDKLKEYKSNFLCAFFNIGLAFCKYAPDIRLSEISERKGVWLQVLSEKWKFDENNLPNDHIYKQLKSSGNIVEVVEQFKKRTHIEVEIFDKETAQPLIVGLGEASPYETGITLDFLTGLPIIPGSALKGITRRAAIMFLGASYWSSFSAQFNDKFGFKPEIKEYEVDGGNSDCNERKNQYLDILPYGEEFKFVAEIIEKQIPSDYAEIFGTQEKKGKVIFMDAYPIGFNNTSNNKLFRIDIMNPHYGPYYESKGEKPPADWYNPVPIPYLTVNTGVRYRFLLLSKRKDLLNKASRWLKFALREIGIGAKGSQGYGVFKVKKH